MREHGIVGSSVIWVILVAATILSYGLKSQNLFLPLAGFNALVLISTAIKIWLIAMRFMEIHAAPLVLKALFHLWLAVTFGTLIALICA